MNLQLSVSYCCCKRLDTGSWYLSFMEFSTAGTSSVVNPALEPAAVVKPAKTVTETNLSPS